MVRALAGDSTMTSLCATSWLLILCCAALIAPGDYPSGPVKVARRRNELSHPSSAERRGPVGAWPRRTGLLLPFCASALAVPAVPQRGVGAAGLDQLVVRPELGDPT